ncbi:hypothetical protein [Caulobacter sp. BK020]|uniref:hypothetical protein n=1 Tax=Caulobacter sp. BK020 TaxID=2512117 RepID=UPI0010513E0E|nr:hypothetical protein [Caulobacter sp. BK020]
MADPTDIEQLADDIATVRKRTAELHAKLPQIVDVAEIGVWSKAPYKALVIRGALAWRTEEMARNACDALEREDRAVGITLARSIIENTALLWRLRKMLEGRAIQKPDTLNDMLMPMLLGFKSEANFPQAVNVLSLIDRLDKEIPGVRRAYDSFSEAAHPNYGGVSGLYTYTNHKEYRTVFGRDVRPSPIANSAAHITAASLALFNHAFNEIEKLMPIWLAELSPLSGPRDPE